MRADRQTVLTEFFKITRQHPSSSDVLIPTIEVADRIGISNEKVEEAAKYLKNEGLLRFRGMGDGFIYSITHGGIVQVEALSETETSNHINIGGTMFALLMEKAQAKESLEKRITIGKALKEKVSTNIGNYPIHDSLSAEADRWDEFNTTLIKRIFPKDNAALAYQTATGPRSVIDVHDLSGRAIRLIGLLEHKINSLKSQVEQLELYEDSPAKLDAMRVTREGVFFQGQYFDALLKITEIIESAHSSIDLVDGYIDGKVLNVLGAKSDGVGVRILTFPDLIKPAFRELAQAFKKQHGALEIRSLKAFHDRFILVDGADLYHIGASIKDAGKTGFMFSRIEESFVKSRFIEEWNKQWSLATVEI